MNANKRECLNQAFAFFHVMEQAKSAFHYVAGIFLRGVFVVMPLGFSYRSEVADAVKVECKVKVTFTCDVKVNSTIKVSANMQ